MNDGHRITIRNTTLSMAGILLFGGFIHRPFPLLWLAVAGVAGTSLMIGFSIRNTPVLQALGIDKFNRRILLCFIPSVLLGVILGSLTRHKFGLSLLPAGLTSMAFVAPLVGAAEELIFRGYILGQVRPSGRVFAIVYASAGHTIYKLLVIATFATPLQFNLVFLLCWTFTGGVLFGLLRILSDSSLPPVIAHAIFDIVLYGGLASAPLWVWS